MKKIYSFVALGLMTLLAHGVFSAKNAFASSVWDYASRYQHDFDVTHADDLSFVMSTSDVSLFSPFSDTLPAISVTPQALTAVLQAGDTIIRTFSVSNTGEPGSILSVSVSTEFSPLISVFPASAQILAGQSQQFNVVIGQMSMPQGTYTQDIIIESNDPVHHQTYLQISIQFQGVPSLSLSENMLDFGIINPEMTRTKLFTVYNTGTGPLELLNIRTTGTPFSHAGPSFITVDPFSEMEIPVTFSSSSPGSFNGFLFFETNLPSSDTIGLPLYGTVGNVVVSFRITDFLGQPVDSATVSLFDGEQLIDQRMTNHNGDVVFSNLYTSFFSYQISKDDHTYNQGNFNLTTASFHLNLVIEAAASQVFTGVNWVNWGNEPDYPGLTGYNENPYAKRRYYTTTRAPLQWTPVSDLASFESTWAMLGEPQLVNRLSHSAGHDPFDLGSGGTFGAQWKAVHDGSKLYVLVEYRDILQFSEEKISFEIMTQSRDIIRHEPTFNHGAMQGDMARRNMAYARYIELGGGNAGFDSAQVSYVNASSGLTGQWSTNEFSLLDLTAQNHFWHESDSIIRAVIVMSFDGALSYPEDPYQQNSGRVSLTPGKTIAFDVRSKARKDGSMLDYMWSADRNNGYASNYYSGHMFISDQVLQKYELTINVLPEGSGSVSSEGFYTPGEPVGLSAVPSQGLAFESWKIGDQEISTQQNFTFIMPEEDVTLTATFTSSLPIIQINPQAFEFGLFAGDTMMLTFTVTNTGDPGSKLHVQIPGSVINFIQTYPASASLSPGQGQEFSILYWKPGMFQGTYTHQIVVSSNDPQNPEITIPLIAHVTGQPEMALLTDSLNFGISAPGALKTLDLEISNPGTADLLISNLEVYGTGFSLAANDSIVVPPTGMAKIPVSFSGTSAGNYSGQLVFHTNALDRDSVMILLRAEVGEKVLIFNVRTMDGMPITNALIMIFQGNKLVRQLVTNAAGSMMLGDLSPGSYTFTVYREGYNYYEGSFDLNNLTPDINVNLSLSPAVIFTGVNWVNWGNEPDYDGVTGYFENPYDAKRRYYTAYRAPEGWSAVFNLQSFEQTWEMLGAAQNVNRLVNPLSGTDVFDMGSGDTYGTQFKAMHDGSKLYVLFESYDTQSYADSTSFYLSVITQPRDIIRHQTTFQSGSMMGDMARRNMAHGRFVELGGGMARFSNGVVNEFTASIGSTGNWGQNLFGLGDLASQQHFWYESDGKIRAVMVMGFNGALSFPVNPNDLEGARAPMHEGRTIAFDVRANARKDNQELVYMWSADRNNGYASNYYSGHMIISPHQIMIIPDSLSINAVSAPLAGGSVTGYGTYQAGDSVVLTATANPGFLFSHWSEGGAIIQGAGATYSFTATSDRNLTAHFQTKAVLITAQAEPSWGGSVFGAGLYSKGAEVSLLAVPNTGFQFKNWAEDSLIIEGVGTRYSFVAENNRTVIAQFEPRQIQISLSVNSPETGSVAGAGNYFWGDTVTLSAQPAENYRFVSWRDGNQIVSTSAQFSFTASSDRNLTANFTKKSYTISLTTVPEGNVAGMASGGGSYQHGAQVTLEASPNFGFVFLGWKLKGSEDIIETDLIMSFDASENRELVAVFDGESFEIVAHAAVEEGSVDGAGSFYKGDIVSLEAFPAPGYYFLRWMEEGNQVSVVNPWLFSAAKNREITAEFAEKWWDDDKGLKDSRILITAETLPKNLGIVLNQGLYDTGETVSLVASPNTGVAFVGWQENDAFLLQHDGITPIGPEYTFTVTETRNITAVFDGGEKYNVSVTTNPANAGVATIPGGNHYYSGEFAQLQTVPVSGYEFSRWSLLDGTQISLNRNFGFTVLGDSSLVAQFRKLNAFDLTVKVFPEGAGSVTGEGSYDEGSLATVSILPAQGYTFNYWVRGDEILSAAMSIDLSITSHTELEAVFTRENYTVAASANISSRGFVTGAGEYGHGQTVELLATPNPGYTFTHWTENGALVPVSGDEAERGKYIFNVTSGRNLLAHFSPASYSVTVSVVPEGAATVTGYGVFGYLDPVQLLLSINYGYEFVGWRENDDLISGASADYSFAAASSRNLTAQFQLVRYTIAATAGSGGSIEPAGNVEVLHGADQKFTFTPLEGYHIAAVVVNNLPAGLASEYIFENITQNFSIEVEFAINTYTLTYLAGDNGSIEGISGQTLAHGTDGVSVRAVPAANYRFVEWSDGSTENPRTDRNVTRDITVTAVFEFATHNTSVELVETRIFPNPVREYADVTSGAMIRSIVVADISGKIILKRDEVNSFDYRIGTHQFEPGIYFVTIRTDEGRVIHKLQKITP